MVIVSAEFGGKQSREIGPGLVKSFANILKFEVFYVRLASYEHFLIKN